MIKKTLYIVIFILITGICNAHPLHLSITNIDIVKNTVSISIKVFDDDFTTAINSILGSAYSQLPNNTDAIKAINNYIDTNFTVKLNGKKVKLKFIDKKHGDFSIWLNYSGKTRKNITEITVSNKILLPWFTDQKNMIIINANGVESGHITSIEEPEISVKF